MTEIINGKIVEGYRVASGQSTNDDRFNKFGGTIALQQPFFKNIGLDLDLFFSSEWVKGTLNISIAPHKYEIIHPDYFFENIHWTDLLPAENFYFVELGILFQNKLYKGLLYQPDPKTKSDHFQPPEIMEIIAQNIPNAVYGEDISIIIEGDKVLFY